MVSLKIKDLHIYYDDFHAVKGVDFEVKDGQILTLLGPSGCGKTTILRSIAGFVEPANGSIKLGDNEIGQMPPQKRDSGMIFQNYALWPHMTVLQNVSYGLKMRNLPKEERRKRALEIIEKVGLSGQEDKNPTQLSGGQQQRVALARALVIEPSILLCDEPLSNLDFKLRVELRTQIKQLTKNLGVTTIYVTHDQTEALAISDYIAVINAGTIEQIGNPVEIFNDPNTLFVANFIGENNNLTGKISNLNDGVTVSLADGTELKFPGLKESSDLSLNDEVTIVTRYDNLLLNENGDNTITGSLIDAAYMGSYVMVEVALSDKNTFTLNVTENFDKVLSISPGSEVTVGIPESEMMLFKGNSRVR